MLEFPKGLIVSCQALEGNPFRDPELLAHMARAAELGGAHAIRANGYEDIRAIRKLVKLPIVGINKLHDKSGRIVITPTYESAARVIEAGADAIALDATFEKSELREDTGELIHKIMTKLKIPVMADISCAEEARRAAEYGASAISTTLAGYLPGKAFAPSERYKPDFTLLRQLVELKLNCPIVAEGRYWRVEDLRKAISIGASAIVIGKAITNPMAITAYFAQAWN